MRSAALFVGLLAVSPILAQAPSTTAPPAQDARARAFAFFINGASLGYLAMAYDSAAIVTPSVPSDVVPDLAFYPDVATAGLALMDSAIAITTSANASSGANGFPLPSTWLDRKSVV